MNLEDQTKVDHFFLNVENNKIREIAEIIGKKGTAAELRRFEDALYAYKIVIELSEITLRNQKAKAEHKKLVVQHNQLVTKLYAKGHDVRKCLVGNFLQVV